ncbi:MAG TPA: PIN domain-containing protein [Actinomycetota bacterium]
MIVVDTTILVYALGTDHPLRGPCRAVMRLAGSGELEVRSTVEVVQEFAHVRARRQGRKEAAARARDYARLLSPLIRPGEDELFAGMELFAGEDGLGAFDAVLAATARARGATLLSADRGFAGIEDLRYVDPTTPDLERHLADSS